VQFVTVSLNLQFDVINITPAKAEPATLGPDVNFQFNLITGVGLDFQVGN
tara:strand:- start:254 stop:403 length:150 start_codon:yes stop_codon:yes gene_type:complete